MPNRILKESICISEKIDSLSWFDEVFLYRLIVNCDDFGAFDARPKILKSSLFPLKESVTIKQIEESLNKLATLHLVEVYEYDGRPFLWLPAWEKHQKIRTKKRKYPLPDWHEMNIEKQTATDCNNLQQIVTTCNNLQQTATDCNNLLPESESESESESNPNTNVKHHTKKHRHGYYQNVLLTDEELGKLKTEFSDWAERIERLSEYIASSGKTYKNHLATIRTWARKEKKELPQSNSNTGFVFRPFDD